ncbi:MAG: bifunctional glutamate N-acetyltransferase/amino-acid acetyltransferase ArgJ, partial [Desulfovibrio sp.]
MQLNGFQFAAMTAGFKKNGAPDLALVVSEVPATAAGVFTTNQFQAAPVLACKMRLANSTSTRAVLINAGQANACTGEQGMADCEQAAALVAQAADLQPNEILPASTGVIGARMDMDKWATAAPLLAEDLGQSGPVEFARAIMTTDAYPKISWAEAETDDGAATVLGICKGAGMICPNMATMLAVVLTDAEVDPEVWQGIISAAAEVTFNRVSVDGDTSTNDSLFGLANGASGVSFVGDDVQALAGAVAAVCEDLARMIVADAEGGTKVLRIFVDGAQDEAQAEMAARAVGNSPLVKTAFYG